MAKNIERQDKSPVARFYNSLAPVYAGLRDHGHKRDADNKDHLIGTLSPFDCDIVLDIGTGPGTYAMDIAKRAPSSHVVGIDISETFVDIAAKRATDQGVGNIEFALGNIERLEFRSDSFSKIICAGVLSVVKNRRQAISELARVLKPAGRLAVREPLRSRGLISRSIGRLPEKSRIRHLCSRMGLMFGHFSPDFLTEPEMKALFSDSGFSKLDFETCGRDILILATK